jgi:hypothetical protein
MLPEEIIKEFELTLSTKSVGVSVTQSVEVYESKKHGYFIAECDTLGDSTPGRFILFNGKLFTYVYFKLLKYVLRDYKTFIPPSQPAPPHHGQR